MTKSPAPTKYDAHIKIMSSAGYEITPDSKILDFGCGAGEAVQTLREQKFDIVGCDLKFKDGPNTAALEKSGHIKEIRFQPYVLPFEDNSFDFIFSDQVFEHVQNYDETIAELRRVLKPGGACLHIFPSRLKPIESHVLIPLASILKYEAWLYIWFSMGFGKKKAGMGTKERVKHYTNYLRTKTNYLDARQIRKKFTQKFDRIEYLEQHFLKQSINKRGRKLYQIGTYLPFIFPLYRTFWSRVLLVR